jgi:hypothetical protein
MVGMLNPYLAYIKIGGAVLVAAILFGTGWHMGGAATRDASDKDHAAQMTKVVAVLEKRQVDSDTELTRRQGIIDAYDLHKDDPSPVVANLGERMRYVTASAACPAVPGAVAVAGGTADSAAEPRGNERTERLSRLNQSVYDACNADAKQMKSMIDLASVRPPP